MNYAAYLYTIFTFILICLGSLLEAYCLSASVGCLGYLRNPSLKIEMNQYRGKLISRWMLGERYFVSKCIMLANLTFCNLIKHLNFCLISVMQFWQRIHDRWYIWKINTYHTSVGFSYSFQYIKEHLFFNDMKKKLIFRSAILSAL